MIVTGAGSNQKGLPEGYRLRGHHWPKRWVTDPAYTSRAPRSTGHALTFTDVAGALRWCEVERENLVAAAQLAADYGHHDDLAWKLPVAVLGSFDRLSFRAEWISSHLIGLASARRAGDRSAEGWTLNNLGMVYSQQQHVDETISRFEEALQIRREIGDLRGQPSPRSTLPTPISGSGAAPRLLSSFIKRCRCSAKPVTPTGKVPCLPGWGRRIWTSVTSMRPSATCSRGARSSLSSMRGMPKATCCTCALRVIRSS